MRGIGCGRGRERGARRRGWDGGEREGAREREGRCGWGVEGIGGVGTVW